MKKQKPAQEQPRLTGKRSGCAIAAALDILGDKWTLLVIRDLFVGRKRFAEFQGSGESIPTNLLSDRLRRLEAAGILHKQAYQEHPPRYEYLLTEHGKALGPVLAQLAHWGIRYAPDPEWAAQRIRERLSHLLPADDKPQAPIPSHTKGAKKTGER